MCILRGGGIISEVRYEKRAGADAVFICMETAAFALACRLSDWEHKHGIGQS